MVASTLLGRRFCRWRDDLKPFKMMPVHTDQRPKTIDLGLKICIVIKDILRRRSTSLEFFVAS